MSPMQVGTYDFLNQSRVVFGKPADVAIGEELTRSNIKRALLVSSRTLSRKEEAAKKIGAAMKGTLIDIYDDIEPHAPLPSVLKLAGVMREERPDIVVTLGGGSVIDTVKVASLAKEANATTPEELITLRAVVNEAGEQVSPFQPDSLIRQIDVPTTLSGAEFGIIGGGVDTERNVKDIYKHPKLCAETIIYDPELARLTPNDLWISTGMRAVDHAVETIQSRGAFAFTDGPALNALRLFGANLKAGDQKSMDLGALQSCQLAVWSSTIGLGRIPYGGSHGMGHQLGAISGVPHGLCSCVLLPAVLKYNEGMAPEKDALISAALGTPDLTASEAVRTLIRHLDLPDDLQSVGVKREDLEKIAAASLGTYFVENNLRPIRSVDDAMAILDVAWTSD
ncbi:lactaldehyde reductase [Rhodobiaceae bacterium]|nr:lactaldehyde reductase [Rhodobiaceae bacterium]